MKLRIDEIDRSKTVTFTDKKTGQPKTLNKVGVKSEGVWYSCFEGEWNKSWEAGQTIDAEVEQRGNYWNIKTPSKPNPQLDAIHEKLDRILSILDEKEEGPF